jgi:hypothetical protein
LGATSAKPPSGFSGRVASAILEPGRLIRKGMVEMFAVIALVLDDEEQVVSETIAADGFAAVADAADWLDKQVGRLKPNGGMSKEHGYWWTRIDGVLTRYVIR